MNLRSCTGFTIALSFIGCGGGTGREDESATATSMPTTLPLTSEGPGSSSATTDTPTEGTSEGSGSGTSATSTEGTSSSSSGTTGSSSGTTGPMVCPEDKLICEAGTAKVCDGMGGFKSEMVCPKECAEPLGCVECAPGSTQCNGQVSQICLDDGSGFVDKLECDPIQGMMCDAGTGQCTGACASLGGLSYIGCDYYPVVTQQLDFYVGANPYAVAVANTAADAAMITVTQGANQILQDSVPANSVKVFQLPWVNELALGVGPSKVVADGAYRLRSTQPVTVYQFNPLNADVTNDASLLLPVNTWTGNYLVVAWPFWPDFGGYPGWYSVSAKADNTTVTLKARGGGTPTQAGGGVDAQGNGVVVLNEGDVLQVMSANGGDGTGSFVTADKPVQVFGGHECTQVPFGVTACDHLEESIFPFETLAKEYIVVPPVQVPNTNAEKAVIVRVVAGEANTTLTFEPDQPVNKVLANVGDFVEIPTTTAKFVVKADKKILVAEYMVGQDAGYGTSDPAMVLAVPSAQYRDNYLFYAQPNWTANFVDIIAPAGAAVQVDGMPVAGFSAIGNTSFSLAHVQLNNGTGGSHSVSADQKVGITVYGVLSYGSYWYPGGLDLELIPQ